MRYFSTDFYVFNIFSEVTHKLLQIFPLCVREFNIVFILSILVIELINIFKFPRIFYF